MAEHTSVMFNDQKLHLVFGELPSKSQSFDTDDRIALVTQPFCVGSKDQPALQLLISLPCEGQSDVVLHPSLLRGCTRAFVLEHTLDATGQWIPLTGEMLPVAKFLRDMGFTLRFPSNKTKSQGRQSTGRFLMVAPTAFEYNPETAQDNKFMKDLTHADEGKEQDADTAANYHVPNGVHDSSSHANDNHSASSGQVLTKASVRATVVAEFEQFHKVLTERAGCRVDLFTHTQEMNTPDACFPNNWISTHPASEKWASSSDAADSGAEPQASGPRLVLYPMKAENRRRERRPDMLQRVLRVAGADANANMKLRQTIDMSSFEQEQLFLEGTGSLVIDRVNGVAYVALSERSVLSVAQRWVQLMGYKKLVAFTATDDEGHPIYHTNVMMAVCSSVAVVALECIKDDAERENLIASLTETGHEIVAIDHQQVKACCANCLEVMTPVGLPGLALSSQAHNAFTPAQREVLLSHFVDLFHSPIDTLERVAGGSCRCLMAEIFD